MKKLKEEVLNLCGKMNNNAKAEDKIRFFHKFNIGELATDNWKQAGSYRYYK